MNYPTILPLQFIAPGETVVSDTIDVSDNSNAMLFVNIGKVVSGLTVLGPITLRVETSPVENVWLPVASYDVVPYPSTAVYLSGSHPAGSTVLNFGFSLGNFAPRQFVFLHTAGSEDLSQSEWNRIKATGFSTITLEKPTAFAHDSVDEVTSAVYNEAIQWIASLNLFSVANLRLVVDTSDISAQIVLEAFLSEKIG